MTLSIFDSVLKTQLTIIDNEAGEDVAREKFQTLTEQGRQALETERRRLLLQLRDYKKYRVNERGLSDEDNKTQI